MTSIITGATIQAKAAKIRCDLVRSASFKDAVKLQALVLSHGLLFKFQKRHGLTSKRFHGEAASVNLNAVESGRIALEEITMGYERDALNMDETTIFYCSIPVKSITKDRISGRKHQKKRLTVALCCNEDGTTKLHLLFVGSVKSPRCFQGSTAEQLGLQYESTKKDG
uniref:DNA binding protein putative n=1 Tax=Albugo laibachii Nc14 TaxID=890382 RepID=F0WDV3_9STRA|nr:DNA binding protein putative [Albugo laibachii Nc14]|eukprot:CCA19381.1 DNA binding protein putative [Albugo laibachii Nc14]